MKIRKPRRIAAARRARNDRQADIANTLGVSQQYISRIERGVESEISPKIARQLARHLGLDLAEIFEADDKIQPRVRSERRRVRNRKIQKVAS